MSGQELKTLFALDAESVESNNITSVLMIEFDNYILACIDSSSVSDEVVNVYKKFAPMKDDAPESMKLNLFATIRNFAKDRVLNKRYLEALILYRFLIVKSDLLPEDYSAIAEICASLENNDLAISFIHLYEKKENNMALMLITLGNFYNLQVQDYNKAIKYYERYLEIDKTKSVIYTILANLYSKVYGDDSLNEQISCYLSANSLKPNDRLILHGLAFGYEKLGDNINSKKYYLELLENNPTCIDYYNYGLFLIHSGELYEGHKYFRARFFIDDNNLKYPFNCPDEKIWDFETDISDKTLLVHYEQGFGDTFMYCRFLPGLKKFAGKIVFVVQDNLCELIKSSPLISEGIEVISDKTDLAGIDYDYSMALLDAPYVLRTEKETIPFCDKYLELPQKMIDKYCEKYLSPAKNLKIGISYAGDAAANYHGRDIDIAKFIPLTGIEGVEIYSLQYGEKDLNSGIIPLGAGFKNFTDTALAIKNMDLIITSDNVVLNLAGALGVRTLGLFNKQTNFRWFKTSGEDVGWYKSVKPLQTIIQDNWHTVFSDVINFVNDYKGFH